MKFFGRRGASSTRDSGLLQTRWFQALVTFCSVLVVIAVCIEVYRRAANYGTKVVEARPVNAEIVMRNPPAWLHREIVSQLLKESYDFARHDVATYNRVRNVLDNDVLVEIADLYTGVETKNGESVSRQAHGFNAWIKRIISVERTVAKDKSRQVIEIDAEWRSPEAWVRAKSGTSADEAGGEMLYLIDADGVRLPGDYPLSDRGRTRLMVIAGIDLPVVEGKMSVPQPGEAWNAGKSSRLGQDLVAGMKLVNTLESQPFAQQIDTVDMTNFNGRKDGRTPWILLNTVWQTAEGSPRVIQWGRPVGQESFYEVQAAAKLQVLNDIYTRFKRIDAGRDYVDIRTEIARLPKLASAYESPAQSPVRVGRE